MDDPTIDGRFVIRRKLESGVLYDVVEARDTASGETVRLSLIGSTWEDAGEAVAQVEAEARRARGLIHPHISPTLYVHHDNEQVRVAEAARGESLESRIATTGPLAPADATDVAMHVCEALAYTHEQGLTHGGLSTATVHFENDEVKVDGFGVLGAIGRAPQATGLARRHRAAFISPEEARGNVPGPESDIYAVGVMLFCMLTGRPPFDADDPMQLARAHCYSLPPRVRDVARGVPVALDSLVDRTLAKDPATRPASMKALLGELRELSRRLGADAASPSPGQASLRPVAVRGVRPGPDADSTQSSEPLGRRELAKALGLTVGRGLAGALLITAAAIAIVSVVFLWLVSTRNPEVLVPDVTGLAQEAAAARLAGVGLNMIVAEERYSSDDPAGTVVQMIAPYASKRVRRGRQVRVVVSRGGQDVRVPHVVDLTAEDAKRELEKSGLEVKEPLAERRHDSIPKGNVIEQDPAGGAVVAAGSRVSLVQSTGPRDRPRVRPDQLSWYRVKVTVPAGEVTQRVRIEVENRDGSAYVAHDDTHLRGHVAEADVPGIGAFTIRVYVNDELYREIRPVRE